MHNVCVQSEPHAPRTGILVLTIKRYPECDTKREYKFDDQNYRTIWSKSTKLIDSRIFHFCIPSIRRLISICFVPLISELYNVFPCRKIRLIISESDAS